MELTHDKLLRKRNKRASDKIARGVKLGSIFQPKDVVLVFALQFVRQARPVPWLLARARVERWVRHEAIRAPRRAPMPRCPSIQRAE